MDNQRAFKSKAMEEFGGRNDRREEDEEFISCKTIEECVDRGIACRTCEDNRIVGCIVLNINEKTQHNHLNLLFVLPVAHSIGIGYTA